MTSRVREALRRGRRDVHHEMSVPALYIAHDNAIPIHCTVRPQDFPTANGRPGGTNAGYAQQADVKPRLIFSTDDAPAMIRQNAVVSVEPGRAYRINFVDPPHDNSITAHVTKLSIADAAALPVPSVDA